jgi:dienelactone hydrolase
MPRLILLALFVASAAYAADVNEREVRFFSKDSQLAGTLALPKGDGPFAAVVLVPEFGPVDRDESWGKGNGTFREIAHHLAKEGIASLRYDPRGVPKSGGNYLTAGLYDFGQDAASALNWMKTLKEIDRARLSVLGHGYGAKAAIVAAGKTPDLAGLVLLAPILGREPEHRRERMKFQMKVDGTDRKEQDKILAEHKYFMDNIAHGRFNEYEEYFLDPALADWIVQAMKVNPEPPKWWRDNMLFDAAQAMAGVKAPVFTVLGETDYLVPADAKAFAAQAKRAGKKDVEVKSFAGLDHRFVKRANREAAYRTEIQTLLTKPEEAESIDGSVLAALSGWLAARKVP